MVQKDHKLSIDGILLSAHSKFKYFMLFVYNEIVWQISLKCLSRVFVTANTINSIEGKLSKLVNPVVSKYFEVNKICELVFRLKYYEDKNFSLFIPTLSRFKTRNT